jgi:short-subunit dehydrogenase
MAGMTTLITGASAGIGMELAAVFARHGHDLVLVARSGERLRALAGDLEKAHPISARVIEKDLALASAPDEVARELQELDVDVLVNNAGFGLYGPFVESELPKQLEMVQLNVATLTHLTGLFLPPMVRRGRGRVLNVASTAAFQPGPLMAVYYATKAYVLSFSEALDEELRGSGVHVTALCPGATETGFASRADLETSRLFEAVAMDARSVAETGYRGLMAGKRVVIPGLQNKFTVHANRVVPRRLAARLARIAHERA